MQIFFGELSLEGAEEFDFAEAPVGHLDGPDITGAFVEVEVERLGVAVVVDDALHVGVAPAGVDPEFDVLEAFNFSVECLEHELDFIAVAAVGVCPEVECGLFDLDDLAAGVQPPLAVVLAIQRCVVSCRAEIPRYVCLRIHK